MEESKCDYIITPKEINTQKHDLFISYRSNSQSHFQDIAPFNYEHRIRLNPFGESKNMDIRYHIPTTHIKDSLVKSAYSSPKKNNKPTAYEQAEIELNINNQINKQRHQELLQHEKNIRKICQKVNLTNKKKLEAKKTLLKRELTRVIKDALKFSKKNSAVRAMLPDNINEIVEKVKKETHDLSITLNLSRVSRISRVSSIGMYSMLEKNDFLNSLGVDMENLNADHVNIDIDKCWNYIVKISKGRNVEDILRYKVVNVIMNLVEKKSAEKAKKIYEKLNIYKKYMEGKKRYEERRKEIEKEKKENELKGNVKEYIKQKMYKSLSKPKAFKTEKDDKGKKHIGKKKNMKKLLKQKRAESAKSIIPETNKIFKRMNAYNDVTKIIKFIDSSKNNSQSKFCRGHFSNIQIAKNMDKSLKKAIEKNEIFK